MDTTVGSELEKGNLVYYLYREMYWPYSQNVEKCSPFNTSRGVYLITIPVSYPLPI